MIEIPSYDPETEIFNSELEEHSISPNKTLNISTEVPQKQPSNGVKNANIHLNTKNNGFHNTQQSELLSIFDDDVDDYTFLPYRRKALMKHYYDQRDIRWVPADMDMRTDRFDYDNKITEDMRTLIKVILAFFTPIDGMVCENLFENFQKDTSFWKECRCFYAEQNAMETIHSEMYSLMAKTLIRDQQELNKIFNAVREYPAVKRISEFIKKYMDRSYTLPERIIAFACVEGILFNSAFVPIYWLKKRNVLRGFCKANEYIARDEGIHLRFAVTLFLMNNMRKKCEAYDRFSIYNIINEAVDVNRQFIEEILPVELIGLSSSDLLKYTKCTADALLISIGYDKMYNEENPFDWMSVISLPNKTNFFEDKVSEYTQNSKGEGEFLFDENTYF